jgi:hypothetical protein
MGRFRYFVRFKHAVRRQGVIPSQTSSPSCFCTSVNEGRGIKRGFFTPLTDVGSVPIHL